MNKELFNELRELAFEYGIPSDTFSSIVKCVIEYKEMDNPNLSESDMEEIIKESIQNYDGPNSLEEQGKVTDRRPKSVRQLVRVSINKIYNYDPFLDNGKDYDYSEENNKHI